MFAEWGFADPHPRSPSMLGRPRRALAAYRRAWHRRDHRHSGGERQNADLRRRVHAGLNKGEVRNALARAVFFNRLGEVRDRSFEDQRHRASGLNLVVAAFVLWNTVYLERAVSALAAHGHAVDEKLLPHLSPLRWDHIALTGDYTWKAHRSVERGQFRALRPLNFS